ncbi:uncharacterized protein [Rutidosis leptorrhynchoides]|uniref:uncharacterized protein n=1 Tax=Rutidosis leptorrhynchoides TaxID=125765 RepID=UPI003A99F742
MKVVNKLFSFAFSTFTNGTNNVALSSQSKKRKLENLSAYEVQDQIQIQSQSSPCLKKSRSYSSGTLHESESESPCSSSNNVSQKRRLGRERNWGKWGSPRKLVKQVIERLSQSRVLPKNINPDDILPITVEDIYGGSSLNCLLCDSSYEERNCDFDDNCSKVLEYEETEVETDEITLLRDELNSRTRKLEKEKNELQMELERELTECVSKLEKFRMEEKRLWKRVRELAEQNVSLEREVSIYREKELESQGKIAHSDQQVKNLTVKVEELVKDKEDRDLFKRSYEEKYRECKELHLAVTRFLKTFNEQEKTIEGLREGLLTKQVRNFDHNSQQSNLEIEQLRLTGVEQALRKEVESYRLEIDSLRRENINLLHRLKASSKDKGFSSFKLDQELWSRIHCLQNQGTCLIDDTLELCSKLIEKIKERGAHSLSSLEYNEALQNGLDSQFIVESDCFN